jgi:hypothetical protein
MPRPVVILAALCLACVTAAAAELFEQGRWRVPVVLPAEPETDEWYAAQTLLDWCERVTGVRPELISEQPGADLPARGLFVGRTAAWLALSRPLPDVDGDVLVRDVEGEAVFLLGTNPIATRATVGRFCEQALGVCFAFPGPRGADWVVRSSVGVPSPERFRPAFAWREISGLSNELSQEWAYAVGYGKAPDFSHGFFRAFNREVYAEFVEDFENYRRQEDANKQTTNATPRPSPPRAGERKAQIDPRRPHFDPLVKDRTPKAPFYEASPFYDEEWWVDWPRRSPNFDGYDPMPRLNVPGAVEIGARYTREWFHQHPGAFSMPFGVNDTLHFLGSPPSEGWYRDRPVRTDYVMGYLNEVAQSFWEPSGDLSGLHHAIGTLGYLQTLRAPTIRLHPAIFPWVCADRSAYAHPDFAAMESVNLAAWVRSGARRVGAYDYWYGVDYTVPRVSFRAQADAIRSVHAAGVVGWYAELAPLWAFDAPKAWLGAKLLQDPSQDAEALLATWFAAAYGPAAAEMRAAYRVLEGAWERDARAGGVDQWIRHFRTEGSTFVLTSAEVAAVSARVEAARRLLAAQDKPTYRLGNQRWRFDQFADAWALSGAFRGVVETRRATDPGNAAEAVAQLTALSAIESAFRRAETAFNTAWGAYGLPVAWSRFAATNPRPEWLDAAMPYGFARLATPTRRALSAWAAGDTVGNGAALWRLAQMPEDRERRQARSGYTKAGNHSGTYFIGEVSPNRRNQVNGRPEEESARYNAHTLAPAGKVKGVAYTSRGDVGGGWSDRLVPGFILDFQVELDAAKTRDPEAKARLVLTFTDGKKTRTIAQECRPAGGRLVVEVPDGFDWGVAGQSDAWRGEIRHSLRYELTFEKEVAVKEIDLVLWSPRR